MQDEPHNRDFPRVYPRWKNILFLGIGGIQLLMALLINDQLLISPRISMILMAIAICGVGASGIVASQKVYLLNWVWISITMVGVGWFAAAMVYMFSQ